MKENKQCSGEVTPGCTSPVQKEGLCYKCYKKKYGHAPYEKKGNSSAKAPKTNTKEKRKINIKVQGNIIDHDKFAREFIPSITKAIKDGREMPVNDRVVTIDFTDYADLYRAIEGKAKEGFRTVSGQILFLVNEAAGPTA